MNDYYSVRVTVTPPSADALDLLADDLGAIGYESFVPEDDGSALTAFVPEALYDRAALDCVLADAMLVDSASAVAERVEGRDWNAEWERNYFRPIVVDGKVSVFSTFHTDVPQSRYMIAINPKMAFGTGHHATTVLMLRFILETSMEGKSVVDMGTGTGILAILAAMRGAGRVLAVEIDAFAVENTRENVDLNLKGAAQVDVVHGDATALEGRGEFADVFLANINRNIITADIARYAAAMRCGALLAVSGFYTQDVEIVREAAEAVGLRFLSVDALDNWARIVFVK